MKKLLFLLCLSVLLWSCSEDQDDNAVASQYAAFSLKFTHNWDGNSVTNNDFNNLKYLNANGEQLSIEALRYLVSNVSLEHENGEIYHFDNYNLVDVTNANNLEFFVTDSIPIGHYNNVSFTFGFNDNDNIDGIYQDLNSASWNVPETLGGGYYYMQLEGKFITPTTDETTPEEIGYQYHTIRAADTSGTSLILTDTSINVNLGPTTVRNNKVLTVEMNVAEWFKNPNLWDLNTLNNMLTGNYQAQLMMNENGQNVFRLD